MGTDINHVAMIGVNLPKNIFKEMDEMKYDDLLDKYEPSFYKTIDTTKFAIITSNMGEDYSFAGYIKGYTDCEYGEDFGIIHLEASEVEISAIIDLIKVILKIDVEREDVKPYVFTHYH